MTNFNNAISLDLSRRYREAIAEYELALNDATSDVNLYINLSFLYWLSISAFVWADAYGIPLQVRDKAFDRYNEILENAISKFSDCAELFFWRKYFEHRLLFDPFTEEDVLRILSTYHSCQDVPYFFLYLFDKEKYVNKRNALLENCKDLPTAKNRYIISIIEDRPYE